MAAKLPEFQIIRDTREQKGWVFDEEEKKSGKCRITGTTEIKLDTGDYSIKGLEHLITIERKNGFSELFGNLGNKTSRIRFEKEIDRMSSIPHCYILVETNLSKDTLGLGIPQGSSMPASRIYEQLLSYTLSHNINVMFVGECGKSTARKIFELTARKYLY